MTLTRDEKLLLLEMLQRRTTGEKEYQDTLRRLLDDRSLQGNNRLQLSKKVEASDKSLSLTSKLIAKITKTPAE